MSDIDAIYAAASLITGLTIGWSGAWYAGSYSFRKNEIINSVIGGEDLSEQPEYHSFVEKIIGFGQNLAEKRYKAGKFDKIINSHKKAVA